MKNNLKQFKNKKKKGFTPIELIIVIAIIAIIAVIAIPRLVVQQDAKKFRYSKCKNIANAVTMAIAEGGEIFCSSNWVQI